MNAPESTVNGTATNPLAGQTIAGRYRVESVLGKGGMGTVYRGVQLGIDRPVAIKVISAEHSGDEESLKRFQREAKVTSQLTHPNTIRLFDFGLMESGEFFFVLELLEGRELSDELREASTLPADQAIAIAIQILRALREAHERGIVHRDLKPDNVFLRRVPGEDLMVKVMDFGIAKPVTGDVTQVTAAGTMIGTPAYMAPEQARGDTLDGRADVYAVGTMIFEMLTGRLPFLVDSENPVQVLIAKLTGRPPRLSDWCDVDHVTDIERVVARMLDDQPASRPDAVEAIELLQKLATDIEHGHAPAAASQPTEAATAIAPIPRAVRRAKGKPKRRGPSQVRVVDAPTETADSSFLHETVVAQHRQIDVPDEASGDAGQATVALDRSALIGAETTLESVVGPAIDEPAALPAAAPAVPKPDERGARSRAPLVAAAVVAIAAIAALAMLMKGGEPATEPASQQELVRPQAEPEPAPPTEPDPAAAVAEPAPKPAAAPTPEPEPAPEPAAKPEPAPEPAAKPNPAPKPAAKQARKPHRTKRKAERPKKKGGTAYMMVD